MLYCHCQIWLISNRSLTMFYNQDRTFTPGCFFITFCPDGLNSDNYCMTEPDSTFVPVQWHLKHWPNVWLFISYRRNQHRASSVHRGVWTSNLWGNGVTPITTEPCVPHGKGAGLFFNKYGTIKSGKSSRYRYIELWKAFLIHDILMVCCPFSNSTGNLHYCQTHYLSAFRSKGKGGYHY